MLNNKRNIQNLDKAVIHANEEEDKLYKFKLLVDKEIKEIKTKKNKELYKEKILCKKRERTVDKIIHLRKSGVGRRKIIKWLKEELMKEATEYLYLSEKIIRKIIKRTLEEKKKNQNFAERKELLFFDKSIDLTRLNFPFVFNEVDFNLSVDKDDYGILWHKVNDYRDKSPISLQEKNLKILINEIVSKQIPCQLVTYNILISLNLPVGGSYFEVYKDEESVTIVMEFTYDG